MRTSRVVLAGFSALALSTSFFWHLSPSLAQPSQLCSALPVRTDAIDNPSKHAWDLFMLLNHPAKDKKVARGEPDCSKPMGAPGTTAVWETWRNAATEVYLPGGAEPPVWSDTTLPDEKPGSVPEKPLDAAGKEIVSLHAFHPAKAGLKIRFSPDGIFNGAGGFGETRLNKATYDFVKDECLFSRDGQARYAAAVSSGKKKPISFPIDAIEVKAAWLDLNQEKIPTTKWRTYYTATYKGKTYGLSSLHIITKAIPNWYWASFHHKDVPSNPFETPDTFGRPKELTGTVWENYVLGGTQIDFTSPSGVATKLSDHYVEFGFQRSSCITCHANATISPTGSMPAAQPKALCAMTPSLPDAGLDPKTCRTLIGTDSFKAGSDDLNFERGTPDPRWYEQSGKTYFLQTDFVWSIPFRGRKETSPPPSRCIW